MNDEFKLKWISASSPQVFSAPNEKWNLEIYDTKIHSDLIVCWMQIRSNIFCMLGSLQRKIENMNHGEIYSLLFVFIKTKWKAWKLFRWALSLVCFQTFDFWTTPRLSFQVSFRLCNNRKLKNPQCRHVVCLHKISFQQQVYQLFSLNIAWINV